MDGGGVGGGGGDLSCEGYCGSSAPGGCYCDDLCEYYGDCCTDYYDVCADGNGGGGGGGSSESCEDCVNDFTAYGSECCDTAWDEYGIDCATLEANYYWDCTGCACPGDGLANSNTNEESLYISAVPQERFNNNIEGIFKVPAK